jgi:hypothetical protein
MTSGQRRKAVEARRALEGKCAECEQPSAPDRSRCAVHLERHARWYRDSRTRARAIELLVWAFAVGVVAAWAPGCGSVQVGSPSDADSDQSSSHPIGAPDAHRPPLEVGYKDAGAVVDVDMPPEGSADRSTCLFGCASCTQSGPTGPGYPDAEVCAAVIACVRSGGGGTYPWQSCHNLAGGGADWGGLSCAQLVAASCP